MSDEVPPSGNSGAATFNSYGVQIADNIFSEKVRSQGLRKVPLAPGHGLRDWVIINAANTGKNEHRIIDSEELKKHTTKDDLWVVLFGKVYNLTSYLNYHPGGNLILEEVGGKDISALFSYYHRWVKHDTLLSSCVVGTLSHCKKDN